jgi:heme/copper-type cytochrome/quinol oxidase subunit 4
MREIMSYALSHLMGFVLSSLVTSFVLVPIYTSTQIARSAANRYTLAFVVFAIVQTVVFAVFIAIRGRPARTVP